MKTTRQNFERQRAPFAIIAAVMMIGGAACGFPESSQEEASRLAATAPAAQEVCSDLQSVLLFRTAPRVGSQETIAAINTAGCINVYGDSDTNPYQIIATVPRLGAFALRCDPGMIPQGYSVIVNGVPGTMLANPDSLITEQIAASPLPACSEVSAPETAA
jgi:hypothetical protein